MSLKSITAAWESGELVNCGFTSSEVSKFHFPFLFTFKSIGGQQIMILGNALSSVIGT
jgi:hypothetical protein